MPTWTEGATVSVETDPRQRLAALERENRLLRDGVGQLTRIRERWTRALDELQATKSRLQTSNQFLDRLLHTAPLPVLVLTKRRGRILLANAAAEGLAGVPPGALAGRSVLRLLEPPTRRDLLRRLSEASASASPGPIALTLTRDGEQRHLELHLAALAASSGEPDRLIVIAQDATERLAAEERLRYQSLHDALTGLPNRLQFRDQLKQAVRLSERWGFKVGVMFLDLDGFKYVNDAYGHDTGDELLQQVALRLQASLRASDTVARFGGDEFALILLGIHEAADVERIARKVIEAVSAPCRLKGWNCQVSASAGISLYPDDAQALDALMKYADLAMYRAKSAGKGCFQFFSADMNVEVSRRMDGIHRLQRGLERGELLVHYQPQVEIARRRVIGFEALVRWAEPGVGILAPAAFIGLAEETGLINPLGELVLRESCRQVAAWAQEGATGLSMAVNLSARQLRHPGLADSVGRALVESGIDPACLVLEVTETALMEDLSTAGRILAGLRELGVRLCLDDFGAGHGSIGMLRRLPFSQIKIGRRLVRELETDAEGVAIAQAIIRMAGALGLQVVAAGVETGGQLRRLEALHCEQAQGFYFARPALAEVCSRLLARQSDLQPSSGRHCDWPPSREREAPSADPA